MAKFCSECSQLIPAYLRRELVYGKAVQTCSEKCARKRKSRLQRERRAQGRPCKS